MDIIDDKELESALVLKNFCTKKECLCCKFYEKVKETSGYYYRCGLERPPEYWRLDIKRGGSNGQI